MYENKESFNSSMDNSSCDENEEETPSEEVLYNEEVICWSNDCDFLDCYTNATSTISF